MKRRTILSSIAAGSAAAIGATAVGGAVELDADGAGDGPYVVTQGDDGGRLVQQLDAGPNDYIFGDYCPDYIPDHCCWYYCCECPPECEDCVCSEMCPPE